MNLLAKIFSVIASILGIFIFGKLKGKNDEKQKQLKVENENLQENIRINKEVSNMSFDDKSDFLLSKQRNKNS